MRLRHVFFVAVAVVFTLSAAFSIISLKPTESGAAQLKNFSSLKELEEYISTTSELAEKYGYFGYYGAGVKRLEAASVPDFADENKMKSEQPAGAEKAGQSAGASRDFSSTNVQVEGVDEADIVKSDGKYLYAVASGRIVVIDAYPADKARVVSRIDCQGSPVELFINKNRLAVIENSNETGETAVRVYDVTDRAKPVEKRFLSFRGDLVNSRMIGDFAYLVVNMPVGTGIAQGDGREKIRLPEIKTGSGLITVPPTEIAYFDYPDNSYVYTVVLAVNLRDDGQKVSARTFLTGTSQNLFVSQNNIYLTNQKTPDLVELSNKYIAGLASLLPPEVAARVKALRASRDNLDSILSQVEEMLEEYLDTLDYSRAIALEENIGQYREKYYRDLARERDNTVIHKLSVKGAGVEYKAAGEVPGLLLNQFSMDEKDGYFRVATTSRGFILGDDMNTKNNIFILDRDMKITGRLQGLARSERIYAARFMGDRVYLVTFRRVDPLFVIDLKDPRNPTVLGELKIPGYSDYLHPYDENHLIGVGMEVPEASPLPVLRPMGGTGAEMPVMASPVQRQGVKIALFDVSNPQKPRELSKFVIEESGSDSPALRDHRAFLFSKAKNLLVIPVSYWQQPEVRGSAIMPDYRRYWQGAFVFSISPEKGVALKGKIEHGDGAASEKGTDFSVKRSMYIENVLYTLSDGMLKANDLGSLEEIKKLGLPI
ncbi:hypothetical protein DCCM_2163 [Desulfocucumis palustris]|uniref:Uncharacterized protein n=1 Tax=Desulfocucumis palustris TaxID=1898651 RepID=A0A2L2XFQ4_9FIRM|nr:beta-propeller domain-containing protein [Desulfocucumis palustris]GBF33066.1 hypothetical protein DCCM_2163 [Desulfocucumis palustris]